MKYQFSFSYNQAMAKWKVITQKLGSLARNGNLVTHDLARPHNKSFWAHCWSGKICQFQTSILEISNVHKFILSFFPQIRSFNEDMTTRLPISCIREAIRTKKPFKFKKKTWWAHLLLFRNCTKLKLNLHIDTTHSFQSFIWSFGHSSHTPSDPYTQALLSKCQLTPLCDKPPELSTCFRLE